MARRPDPRFLTLLLAVVPAALLGMLYQPSTARSYPAYPPLVPNRAFALDASSQQAACITCHDNPNGGLGCTGTGGLAPCFNPFGLAFRDNGKVWSTTLAMIDSDGDGFSNGQELQDPAGTWLFGLSSPGIAAYVTRPGFSSSSPGQTDADHDAYCWFGHDTNNDHDCLDAGEQTTDFDCDDSRGTVHSGATELCDNTGDDDCNGLDTFHDPVCASVVDVDQDGYCPMGRDLNADRLCSGAGETTTDVDCDDTNLLVRPGAPENCQDGIDNDCDTLVDSSDPNCTGEGDADADGYCPIGQDVTDDAGTGGPDGDCLDGSEPTMPSDCNDSDALVNPGRAEVCGDLEDNDCDLLADFADPSCFPIADKDHDGYCPNGHDVNGDGDCIDTVDTQGPGGGFDCDDSNSAVFSRATEICSDLVDQDCDGQPGLGDTDCYVYLDADGDGYCPVGGIDLDANGNCVDAGESSRFADCNDTSASIYPSSKEHEICTNGVDDNCDGISDAHANVADDNCIDYADWDWDGYCAIGVDANLDGDCADVGEQTAASDARPYDSTVSPGNHESCFDLRDNDQDGYVDLADPECVATKDDDGDGYCPVGRDLNGDADCTDPGENYGVSDCNDSDPAWGPQMAEIYIPDLEPGRCFDLDDNDCDGKVDLADLDCFYVFDKDGDGICGHGDDVNHDGDCLDLDEQVLGGDDCDDDDPARASNHIENCSNGIDDDCDSLVDAADPTCFCQLDSECPAAPDCQIAHCMSGACVNVADTACVDFSSRRSSGMCSVEAAESRTGGRPASAFGLFAAFSLIAISIRRLRRPRALTR